MGKIKKIILISICLFLAICQLGNITYSYTIDEVKDAIKFKTVEDDGEPSHYDILIDADDLKENVEFPYIKNSEEKLIYKSNDLFDINFLNVNSTNNDVRWKKISQFVRASTHVLLYIGTALLLTLLIYIGVHLGFKSFSSSENGHLPLEGIINRNASGTPAKGLRDKRVIEQWIVTVILMGLITFIITVTIYFANYITDISSTYKIKHRDINAITIYVKSDNDNSLKKNYYFKTSIEGMLMFQTQYKWKAHPLKNIINGLGGAVIAIFKGFLLALFAIRMVLVAILIVIAPIVVIINGFLKVYGNRGILGTWYKIFLYMCLLKPLIAIVYYILVKCNVYLVNEFSLYLVFVVAIIMIAFYASARWLLKSLRSNRQQYE